MRRLLLSLLLIAACENATTLTSPEVSFLVISGDGQSGTVGQPLGQPLVIKATDSNGKALRNVLVVVDERRGIRQPHNSHDQ